MGTSPYSKGVCHDRKGTDPYILGAYPNIMGVYTRSIVEDFIAQKYFLIAQQQVLIPMDSLGKGPDSIEVGLDSKGPSRIGPGLIYCCIFIDT